MASSASSGSAGSSGAAQPKLDPITRNALRYTVSAREYELLHQYLISRAPAVRKRAPRPKRYESAIQRHDDYNAANLRISLRLFAATYSSLKIWDLISSKLFKRGPQPDRTRRSLWRSPNLRLALSLSSILYFHRFLHRFFLRLRESLLTEDAKAFRRRNPRVSRLLTSKIAPAAGASLAGSLLGIYPGDQLRITIAIYFFSRSLEFLYNSLEDNGYFKDRPWWFGSWMIMPAACGQLLHAFVFDRDCFPAAYGGFILKRSPNYIQQRPADYPSNLKWPDTFSIVDNLAEISRLKWPSFISPILFPTTVTLPASVAAIAPITDPAHPAIKHLSCAVLHPNDPSCLRTYITYYIHAFPQMAKFFAIIYGVFSLPRYKAFMAQPLTALNALAARILRTSFFLTSAIGTAWSSICLLQRLLPRHLLPTSRWFLSGFLAGLWAFVERGSGRGNFMYSARMSIDSLWKVGKKRGWWKGLRNGDVMLFTASLMVWSVIYEKNPKALTGGVVRKSMGVLRGEGWVDRAAGVDEDEDEGEAVEVRDKKSAEGIEPPLPEETKKEL